MLFFVNLACEFIIIGIWYWRGTGIDTTPSGGRWCTRKKKFLNEATIYIIHGAMYIMQFLV